MSAIPNLTLRNADAQQLLAMLQRESDLKLDAIVPATKIRSEGGVIVVDGLSVFGDQRLNPTEIFVGHVAEKLNIPVRYLRRLQEERPDLFDNNINGLLHGLTPTVAEVEAGAAVRNPDPRSFFVRSFVEPGSGEPGIARSLHSDRYGRIDNLDTLVAAVAGINEAKREAPGLEVNLLRGDVSERRMAVRFTSPSVTYAAPELLKDYRSPYTGQTGAECPLIEAGFEISNSETGFGALNLNPYFRARVCDNGLVIDLGKVRRVHLGSQLDEGIIRASDDTQEKSLALITAQVRDAVRTFFDPTFLVEGVTQLEKSAGVEVTDPVAVVELVGQRMKYTEAQTAEILGDFIKAGQVTTGGVLQAITSYSQRVENPDEAYDLEHSAVEAMETAVKVQRELATAS